MLTDNGYSRVIWDGDADAVLNFGLGGVDLTGAATRDRFRTQARSDIAGKVHLAVFTSATAYSFATFDLPAAGIAASYSNFAIPFASMAMGAPALLVSDLGLGVATSMADFTNVNAIAMFIDGTLPNPAGLDAQFTLLEVNSNVPEPATFGLVGAALAAASLLRRKRV
jgi:hypothetical protein